MQPSTKAASLREVFALSSAGWKYKGLGSIAITQGLTLIWILKIS